MASIRVQDKWKYGRRKRGLKYKKRVVSGRLNDTSYVEEYKRMVTEVLREVSVGMGEELEVEQAEIDLAATAFMISRHTHLV